jgi:hypothetical protein
LVFSKKGYLPEGIVLREEKEVIYRFHPNRVHPIRIGRLAKAAILAGAPDWVQLPYHQAVNLF